MKRQKPYCQACLEYETVFDTQADVLLFIFPFSIILPEKVTPIPTLMFINEQKNSSPESFGKKHSGILMPWTEALQLCNLQQTVPIRPNIQTHLFRFGIVYEHHSKATILCLGKLVTNGVCNVEKNNLSIFVSHFLVLVQARD